MENLNLKPKRTKSCKQIEVRVKNIYTVLPPSIHPDGKKYKFIKMKGNSIPKSKPKTVSAKRLSDTIDKFCDTNPLKNLTKIKSELQNKLGPVEMTRDDKRFLEDAHPFLQGKIKDHYDWIACGFALADYGEDGREYFIRIGLDNPKFPDTKEVLDHKFDELLKNYNNEVPHRSIFQLAIKYGWDPPKDFDKSSLHPFDLAYGYLNIRYEFIYNEVKNKIYRRKK